MSQQISCRAVGVAARLARTLVRNVQARLNREGGETLRSLSWKILGSWQSWEACCGAPRTPTRRRFGKREDPAKASGLVVELRADF